MVNHAQRGIIRRNASSEAIESMRISLILCDAMPKHASEKIGQAARTVF